MIWNCPAGLRMPKLFLEFKVLLVQVKIQFSKSEGENDYSSEDET
jgi:hypothetical protein